MNQKLFRLHLTCVEFKLGIKEELCHGSSSLHLTCVEFKLKDIKDNMETTDSLHLTCVEFKPNKSARVMGFNEGSSSDLCGI